MRLKATYPSIAWLFVLGIAGYPLTASLTSLLGVENQPVAIAYRALFLGYSLSLLWIALKDNAPILKTHFWFLYFGFWALYLARIVFDTIISEVPTAFAKENYLLFGLGVSLLPSLAFARQLDRSTSLVSFVYCMFGIGATQLLFLASVSAEFGGSLEYRRVQSETLNAISYGLLGAVSVLLGGIGLVLFAGADARRHWFDANARGVKVLCIFSIMLGAATMFLASSRGPFLSAFLCLAVAFFRALRFAGNRIGIAVFAIGFVLSSAIVLLPFLIDLDIPLFERIFRTMRGEELSDNDRLYLWALGWEQFVDSPLFGSGLEEKSLLFYVHNLPLEALMSTGIFGGALWIALLLAGVRRALHIIWSHPSYAWIAMLFLLLMSNSFFSGNLWNSGAVSYFMVALYAVPIPRASPALDFSTRSSSVRA